jgi:hypothetical protein
VEGYS